MDPLVARGGVGAEAPPLPRARLRKPLVWKVLVAPGLLTQRSGI